MQVFHTIKELRSWRKDKNYVCFVPTMGNLHDGHIKLIKEAKKASDHVIVSIFVNPIQFGENEDFAAYPRTLDVDADKLFAAGVSALFIPELSEIYPIPQTVFVELPAIEKELCGATRKNHFKGVATIVNKLFNIVQPNAAYFGKKDYQQLFIITQMVHNFNIPVQIIGIDTQRAEDGLALSSRNGYLTSNERMQAPALYKALLYIKQAIQQGNTNFTSLAKQSTQQLNSIGWQVDYIEVRNADTLQVATDMDTRLVILAAARLGSTRLIDNIELFL